MKIRKFVQQPAYGCGAKSASAGLAPRRLPAQKRGAKASAGFVFSIDAALAAFLMILVLEVATFLSIQADESQYGSLQIARAGNDALAVMAATNALSSANSTTIEGALNSTLPENMGAHLEISTYHYDSGNFIHANTTAYGESPPANTTAYLARRDFASSKYGMAATYSIARMLVWQK